MASLLWASRDIRVNGRRLSYSSALPALESPALLNSLGSTIPIINNSRYTNRPLARTEDLLAGGSRALGFRAPGFHREPTTRDSATCTGQGYRDAPDWTTVGPMPRAGRVDHRLTSSWPDLAFLESVGSGNLGLVQDRKHEGTGRRYRQGEAMRCPYCNQDDDKVIDTRAAEDGNTIRRRRQCLGCDRRYTTYERLAEFDLRVIKKNGEREPFQPEKIRSGLQKACWKRAVSEEQLSNVLLKVQQEVSARYDNEIPSDELGEIVMKFLSDVDQVAYVRFASVYREFKDVRDFVDELSPMLRRPEPNGAP